MGRILAFDYGRKRTGLAVSDPLRIIANGLDTIRSMDVWEFLKEYLATETVDQFIVGLPLQMNHSPSESMVFVERFVKKLGKNYPDINIEMVDERFSSKIARRAMIEGGLKKKDRRDKTLVDKLSAVIILQSYIDSLARKK